MKRIYEVIDNRLQMIKQSFYVALSIILCLLLAVFASCQNQQRPQEAALFVLLDSVQTHIGFTNKLPEQDGNLNIIDYLYYYNGGGVAAGDINNDGLTDLFFVSNQDNNKLYLNRGDFQFEDITETAGVLGYSDWQTGVTMADVNGDGLLDIYVCAVSNYKGLEGSNELYINNGDLTFTERAADYGLDFSGFSTQAAFFDYDRDGDLDMYLLNHAVHTSRSYDRVSTRELRHNEAGDRIFENQLISADPDVKESATKFIDVSSKTGIYQAAMGYGLGVVASDINNDGWDDIYVANDFHEDDYFYLNNGDGTFTESVKNHFRHLSRFSMGCDVADINNDGYLDIMTLDMYPEDEEIEKTSMGEDPLDIFLYKLKFGYFPQYSRNCLHLSWSGEKFTDIGAMAGVAATDWSWSTLLADYDNDGIKDIFVSNGVVRRPNNLDYIKFASEDSMKYALEISKAMDEKAISLMPEGKAHNYLFKGTESTRFKDKSLAWGFETPTISNGAAYADLDNDGDLDLITNNINEPAGIYRNNSEGISKNNYLKIKLAGDKPNTFGLGAKVVLKSNGKIQVQQLSPTRGFISSVEPALTFGLGELTSVDTLIVVWGNQKTEIQTNITPNRTLVLKQSDAQLAATTYYDLFVKPAPIFAESANTFEYEHKENNYLDFYREGLMPFKVSTEGPHIAVGDVNGDGLEDVYLGGAKWQPGALFIQSSNGQFISAPQSAFNIDSTFEDVDAVFFDADNDNDLDLYVVTGGNEFYGKMVQQFDRLYLNDGEGSFTKSDNLPPMFDNKSCVAPEDFDQDGDIDLFVGGRVVGYGYGNIPNSYLLENDGNGNFTDRTEKLAPALRKAGMVTDAEWADYDNDGDMDLVVAGDWMPIKVFENQNNSFTEVKPTGLAGSEGLWQTIKGADFDNDGDTDFIVGNIGTNTKLRKKEISKLKMYVKDFGKNETTDQILCYNTDGKWYTVATKDELGKQMPSLNKKFTNYKDFAGKTVNEIFSEEELSHANVLEVNMFESVYLENLGNKQFKVQALPAEAQVSKIFSFYVEDINRDGNPDVLIGGNLHGVSTYQGRYDGSYGLLLQGDGKGSFLPVSPTACGFLLEGEVRDIKPLETAEGSILLVARNGLPLQIFKRTDQDSKGSISSAR